jgi:uncharacterized repeat protein (TIGR03843 family)
MNHNFSPEPDDTPAPTPISPAAALDVLENGTIQDEQGQMRWSSNFASLLTVNKDDLTLLAVYKPRRGERPLWDFPDGTLCQRERAAFLTSQELGWQIVPPTALREGPRGVGSLQLFIDHDPELHYFTFPQLEIFEADIKPRLMMMCAFDWITNNTDRKGGHCLLDAGGHVWGIDHGLTFHAQNKLRTVIWEFANQPLPTPLIADIERLCAAVEREDSAYRQAMCTLLDEVELLALHKRIRQMLRAGKFPDPGRGGPNYPWPPV